MSDVEIERAAYDEVRRSQWRVFRAIRSEIKRGVGSPEAHEKARVFVRDALDGAYERYMATFKEATEDDDRRAADALGVADLMWW